MSSPRSPSKQVLPKRTRVPQNRCYQGHRKGGPVTERARREYAEVLRRRYVVADKRERGRILDEYCRTTHCHRKAAIRRLGQRPRLAGRPPGRPRRYGRELLPLLGRVGRASDYLSGKLLVAILPRLLAALEQHHGLVVAPPLRVAPTAASP